MKRIGKRIISLSLSLMIVFQISVSSSAVTNNLATVELKGKVLTATLYDNDISQNTLFARSDYDSENLSVNVVWWIIEITDGTYKYGFFAGISNADYESAGKNQLSLADGHSNFGKFEFDEARQDWILLGTFEGNISVINHKVTWSVTLADDYKIGDKVSILGYQIEHDNHSELYGESWPNSSASNSNTSETANSNTSEIVGSIDEKGYKQVHVVKDWDKENKEGAKKYLNGASKALSNSDYSEAFVIPGQDKRMVPQGLTYWEEKNWFLVSSYYKMTDEEKDKYDSFTDKEKDKKDKMKKSSVIFAIDAESGKCVAQFNLFENVGGDKFTVQAKPHLGGIAVSDNNLYLTYYGSTIAYVPLSNLNVKEGTVKNIKISGKVDLANLMNGTSMAYMTCSEGKLWFGNFYCTKVESWIGEDNWNTPASKDNNTVILGYNIKYNISSSDKSADEWNHIKNTVENNKYDYRILIPNWQNAVQLCDGIQGMAITGDTLFLSRAKYRPNNKSSTNEIIVSKIKPVTDSTANSSYEKVSNLPGGENILIKDGKMYSVYESGALKANVGDGAWELLGLRRATDVIWETDINKMLKDVSLHVYNCPVDIEVVNKDTKEVVCRIKDNVVDENVYQSEDALIAEVDGDSKMIWIPSEGNYEIKVTGNDKGNLDHSVSVFNENAEISQRKNFFDVDITDGLTLTGDVNSGRFNLKDYTLHYKDGKDLEADEYFDKASKSKLNITVSSQGKGDVAVPDDILSGDYVTLEAKPEEGAEFIGWYENDTLISEEQAYSFVAKTNRDITAKFSGEETNWFINLLGKILAFFAAIPLIIPMLLALLNEKK